MRPCEPSPAAVAIDPQSGIADRLTPTRALALACVAWIACLILAPIDPVWPDERTPVLLLGAAVAATFLGMALPSLAPRSLAPRSLAPRRYAPHRALPAFHAMLRLCMLAACLGIAARLFDLVVLRHIDATDSLVAAREQSARIGANPVSLIAAGFGPLGLAALTLALVGQRAGLIARVGAWPWVLAAAVPLSTVRLGSRSAVLIASLHVLLALLLTRPHIRARHVGILGATVLVMAAFFTTMFLWRAQAYGFDLRTASRYSVYAQSAPLSATFTAALDRSGALEPLLIAGASMLQYAVHAVFEFFILVSIKSTDFAHGAQEFFFVPKLLAMAGGGEIYSGAAEILRMNPRSGVFQTFYGDAYIDFGPLLVIPAFGFGLYAGGVRRAVLAGNVFWFPAYIALLAQALMIPFYGGLGGATVLMHVTLFGFAVAASLVNRLRAARPPSRSGAAGRLEAATSRPPR